MTDRPADPWGQDGPTLPSSPPVEGPVAVDGGTVRRGGLGARVVADPAEAVDGADVVVTDTWISMGQAHAETKLAAMRPYQVDAALMARAKPGAAFLHCLPAHRGEEVTADVIDGAQSLIWVEAENRLHAQKSILRWCFGQIG